ncbi:MAG: acyl-CoA dehydrogenase [Alcanivoracaceae bacterium]|nr:acyl-CoA dehydrogenase [Alcanivoracaceae bacterium]
MSVLIALLLVVLVIMASIYLQLPLLAGSLAVAGGWLLAGAFAPALYSPWLWIPALVVMVGFNLAPVRRRLISAPVFAALGKAMPSMSATEREALEAGTTWWDKDLFCGKPDWSSFNEVQLPTLTDEEQSFLDNEVAQLCAMLDEWDIHHYRKDLPEEAWQFLKDKGFFSLIIPKEFGGKDFSPYAQSRIMSKIATRSITAAVTAMVPNSLGPGELLMKYGTDEQKQQWLPGLAKGTDIPCFGLTGPEAGSDAGAIPDLGVVCKGTHDGKEVVGIRLNFSKRWITLAPVATVVGLAFQLRDPDGLLGDDSISDYGITCALIPADHDGVEIGRRHYPGSPFMNGPITGKDVFIPADWIIGGPKMAGKGWRMLIECLGAGRGVSLPALATASGEVGYRMVGAFSRIRRQFKTEVGKFEGVQEATAQIASQAYTLEAMRHLVTKSLETGTPSVISAMAKYHATEMMRTVINHGMDVAGGRAIQLGPRNFMALPYQSVPIAITVEGANILTRSLMIFGQGAMRCHPYLFDELEAIQDSDSARGLKTFDKLFFAHAGYTISRTLRALVMGLSGARLAAAPASASDFSKPWYQQVDRMSAALSATADVALAFLGGDLKRRELLSARLGDVHSQLFIACSILKYHENQPRSRAEDAHATIAVQQALYSAQEAFYDFFDNFPARAVAMLLKRVTFPFGRSLKKPDDDLIREVGDLVMEDSPVRQAFGKFVYIDLDPEDAMGRVESTYQMLLEVEPQWNAFLHALDRGKLDGDDIDARLASAVEKGVISENDVARLKAYDERRYDALLTDAFEKAFFEAASVDRDAA